MLKFIFTVLALCIFVSHCNGANVDDDVITEFVVDMLDLDFEEMAIDDDDGNEAGYEGLLKAKPSSCFSRNFDVMFLLDTSSTNAAELSIMKEWLLNLVISLGYWDDTTTSTPVAAITQKADGKLGIIQFTHNSTVVYPFSYPASKLAVFDAIYGMKLKDHGRRLGEALHHCNVMAWDQQHSSNFSRTANRKILVIVSNGPSEDNASSAAKTMKDSGVEIIYIGLKNSTLQLASDIASQPDKKHTFLVKQYESLETIKKKVKWKLCKRSKEKKNVVNASSGKCSCKDGKNGKPGSDGARGPKGETGAEGKKGEKGHQGKTGARGKPGIPGKKGATGPPGPPGPSGPYSELYAPRVIPRDLTHQVRTQVELEGKEGPVGPTGPAGPAGPTGPVGPVGEKGSKGDSGSAGTPGNLVSLDL